MNKQCKDKECDLQTDEEEYGCLLSDPTGEKCYKPLMAKKDGGSKVPCSDGFCATTQANLKGEILDRMNHFYLQTDGTHKWPNSAEGDLLKMAHKLISA